MSIDRSYVGVSVILLLQRKDKANIKLVNNLLGAIIDQMGGE